MFHANWDFRDLLKRGFRQMTESGKESASMSILKGKGKSFTSAVGQSQVCEEPSKATKIFWTWQPTASPCVREDLQRRLHPHEAPNIEKPHALLDGGYTPAPKQAGAGVKSDHLNSPRFWLPLRHHIFSNLLSNPFLDCDILFLLVIRHRLELLLSTSALPGTPKNPEPLLTRFCSYLDLQSTLKNGDQNATGVLPWGAEKRLHPFSLWVPFGSCS